MGDKIIVKPEEGIRNIGMGGGRNACTFRWGTEKRMEVKGGKGEITEWVCT